MTRIAMIAAMDQNRLIGNNNEIPWKLSADLRRFKRVTMGKPVVMGRRTFASIGRALPGRPNHVISHNPDFAAPGCRTHRSIDAALRATADAPEIMILGGAQIYANVLPRADYLYLTMIHACFTGDTWFPAWQSNQWREMWREDHDADDNNNFSFSYVNLARVR